MFFWWIMTEIGIVLAVLRSEHAEAIEHVRAKEYELESQLTLSDSNFNDPTVCLVESEVLKGHEGEVRGSASACIWRAVDGDGGEDAGEGEEDAPEVLTGVRWTAGMVLGALVVALAGASLGGGGEHGGQKTAAEDGLSALLAAAESSGEEFAVGGGGLEGRGGTGGVWESVGVQFGRRPTLYTGSQTLTKSCTITAAGRTVSDAGHPGVRVPGTW